ncbi:J domain-containing protein [Synechococcus sp. LA31]|uniref:J domain-containing protein n=1 Tax=Synechococcus sp. LA31 TaxID=2741953 RepID=UPI001BDCA2D2|nr:J domain-containing protein [Synechococcus sp. LA31]QVV68370.1 J domain-containing protein [Synechococcus sp. LA31]
MADSGSDKRRITLELSEDLLSWIDSLKSQMGFRNRGLIVDQLLRELLPQQDDADSDPIANESETATADEGSAYASLDLAAERFSPDPGELDETRAIVLIGSTLVSLQDQDRDSDKTVKTGLGSPVAAGGIQLPGFVRRQARAVKRSLAEQATPTPDDRGSDLALIAPETVNDALHRAQEHWLEVYGQPPGDAVDDAALSWLARDIWPQSDHSDARPFTWGLAQQVLLSLAPSWPVGEPSLARVITAAGILEDPFSGSSLPVRVPTLITRFVQRQRSRNKRTTSFEAIDQSMTVHGALRLLQLPTIADRPYTLKEIRDAYRGQAQSQHPDAGGSADAMRRLNEAYQFLKERYRRAG